MGNTFILGLLSAGSKICDAGILPTPTLAYTIREFDAGASTKVSTSSY